MERNKRHQSCTASSVHFLETAVICTYWYEFRIPLKSEPRYIKAMRPGSSCVPMLKMRVTAKGLSNNIVFLRYRWPTNRNTNGINHTTHRAIGMELLPFS